MEIPEHIVAESPQRFKSPNDLIPPLEQSPATTTLSFEQPSPEASTFLVSGAGEHMTPSSPKPAAERAAAAELATPSPQQHQGSSAGLSLSMLSKVSMKAGAAAASPSVQLHAPRMTAHV